jgi:hypothetical protein
VRRAARWLALFGSMGAVLLAGLAVLVASGARAQSQVAGVPTMRTARNFVPSPPRERAAPRGRAEWVDPAPDNTGLLDTPSALWNHRVFIDGLTRGAGGDVIRVPCGRHSVRLGSSGRVQSVDVPCGGTVVVNR